MAALLLLAASCVKDNGSYGNKAINVVTISGIAATYQAELGKNFSITPNLNYSLGEEHDDFKYEWHVMRATSPQISLGVLSTEKDLNVTVEPNGLIGKAGSYTLMYCVTNLNTGIRYDYPFTVVVSDKMLTGCIVLHETADNSFDVDMIANFNDTLNHHANLLALYQSALPRQGRKALDIVCYKDAYSPSLSLIPSKDEYHYAVWILTDQSTDRVTADDYEYKPEFNISNLQLGESSTLVAEKMFSTSYNTTKYQGNYVLSQGNLYFYTHFSNVDVFYGAPVNTHQEDATPYSIAPYIFMAPSAGAVVFNKDEHAFELHDASTAGMQAHAAVTTPLGNGWSDPNWEPVYIGNRTDGSSYYLIYGFAIVKDGVTNQYQFLQMSAMGGMSATVNLLSQTAFPTGTDLSNMRFYAFHPTLPYLFFATEDKVYRVNVNAMNSVDDVTASVLLPGQKISLLKSTAVRFPTTNNQNKMLMVATYDPTGQAGQNAQLAFYNVEDGTGDLTPAKYPATPTADGFQQEMKWTGLGKVIGADYKQPTK
jgi:hypothetical protein